MAWGAFNEMMWGVSQTVNNNIQSLDLCVFMLCGFYTRLHDLFIEKAEFQESLESVNIEFEERMKSLVEENDYLSELVGSTVLQSVI